MGWSLNNSTSLHLILKKVYLHNRPCSYIYVKFEKIIINLIKVLKKAYLQRY